MWQIWLPRMCSSCTTRIHHSPWGVISCSYSRDVNLQSLDARVPSPPLEPTITQYWWSISLVFVTSNVIYWNWWTYLYFLFIVIVFFLCSGIFIISPTGILLHGISHVRFNMDFNILFQLYNAHRSSWPSLSCVTMTFVAYHSSIVTCHHNLSSWSCLH